MAHDRKIPLNAPGIAGFATESIGSNDDPRFGDSPEPTTTTVAVPASFTGALYEVVALGANGIEKAVYSAAADYAGGKRAYGILTAPVVTGVGQTTTLDVYRSGHWNMDALVWPASFDTDAKKKAAFEGSLSPTIFVSKKKFNSDAIDV